MDKTARKRRGFAEFDPQTFADFLLERHPVKTAQAVSAASGLPAKTIERWLAKGAKPSIDAFTRLLHVYGPAFGAASLPGMAWMQHAAALATHEGMTCEIERLYRERAIVARRLGFGGDRS